MRSVDGMPVKGDGDSGDSMLWAGLMVAVGDRYAAGGIKKCQTPDGRLWRCTDRVNNQPSNSFSRDMSLGFILYFAKTKDHEMADKWISYIKKTGSLFPASESTDTRHLITPSVWWLMSYAGMRVPLHWRLTRFLLKPYQRLEMKFSPKGFQSHLQGVSQFILAMSSGKRDKAAGAALLQKEPNNAFFAWLAGEDDKARAINDTLRAMWSAAPGDFSQWCWERTDSEEAWRDSMGWDFHFIDLLLTLNLE
jgi:hypothetical protein